MRAPGEVAVRRPEMTRTVLPGEVPALARGRMSLRAGGDATWRAEVAEWTGTEPIRAELTRKP